MAKTKKISRFTIIRDEEKCIKCQVCVRMCSFDTHSYDEEEDKILSKDENCGNVCIIKKNIAPTIRA